MTAARPRSCLGGPASAPPARTRLAESYAAGRNSLHPGLTRHTIMFIFIEQLGVEGALDDDRFAWRDDECRLGAAD